MSQESETYSKLLELRERLKFSERRTNGRAPVICSDEALRDMAKYRPQTLEDLESIPGIGKTFVEKYGSDFLSVIHATETDSSKKALPMAANVRSTLEKLETRLVNLNKRNRNLYFPKRQNKSGLDLCLNGRNDPRDIIWSNKKTMVIADLTAPVYTYDTEKSIHLKFNTLIRENENERRDKGQNVLYLAYPFVKGMIEGEEFNVRAPLAYIPVIAERNASRIAIQLDTDRDILYNSTLIMAYCKFTGRRYEIEDYVIEDIHKETFIDDLLGFYNTLGISIRNEDPELHSFTDYTQDTFPKYQPGTLYLENCAILGNFPQFSSTVQLDFQKILENGEINNLVEELLKNYDEEDDFRDSSGDQELEIPDKDLPVSEDDLIYINDLNSSQENVISAIKKEDKLVVKGPPGTGKSQMIASLIADFACNGKTVLLVSEKKTALDVVYSRLGKLSVYSMLLDDVGSKDLFYSTLGKMFRISSESTSYQQTLQSLSEKIDSKILELQEIANSLYKPDSFGIEPYKLYLKDKTDPADKIDRLTKVSKTDAVNISYNGLEEAFGTFSNPNMVSNVRTNDECITKCPVLEKYPSSLSTLEFKNMTEDLRNLLEDVREYNRKGFFGKLFGKKKMKNAVDAKVTKYFGQGNNALSDRIFRGDESGLFCDERTYVDYDKTRSVVSKLTPEEREYLKAMKSMGGLDQQTNEELFESLISWHLDVFESRHRDVISKIDNFEQLINDLRELIKQKKEVSREQMRFVLSSNMVGLKNEKRGNEIIRQIEAKRKWSVNKFIRKFKFEVFKHIKIWMMTPEVVSEIVPLQKGMFDLVVFDEASQMFVEKGIPAILRANKVVVCGDEKQLRPNFVGMRRMSDNLEDEVDEDDLSSNAALEEESLLDLARSRYKCTILNFHYRSKYEELIAFSNYGFYNGRLFVSPNATPPEVPPIEVIKTYDAVWANKCNEKEAQRVVSLLKQIFLTRTEGESIGIITFNTSQRDLIDDLINEKRRTDPEFDRFVSIEIDRKDNGEDIGLFVKNIENVQGDERDIIIFSTTYAKDSRGRLIRQFGTMSMDGGENRLNVAVSRAKKKIYVVTSFDPEEFVVTDLKGNGPKYFKKYLQYAHAVSNNDQEKVKQILLSFGDDLSPGESLRFDSEFENEVYDKLIERGLNVDSQVGVGGYSIDLAVKDEHGYVLGIECDGKLYHSSASARERDLHRQNYLESRGWRIHRIWSPNWWRNSEREVDKICEIVKSLIKQRDEEPPKPPVIVQPSENTSTFEPQPEEKIDLNRPIFPSQPAGGRGLSVTNRIDEVKQPYGGFIRPKSMSCEELNDGKILGDESIAAGTMGMVVDYLTRYSMGTPVDKAFRISLMGASRCNSTRLATKYLSKIVGLDDQSINYACKLTWFDQVYRAGTTRGSPDAINADPQTCENIRIMVKRAKTFFELYGPLVMDGPTFGMGYTNTVAKGDGDFVTNDTIWDFKVSKSDPNSKNTLQLAMYFLMGRRSMIPELERLTKIGIFNPRLNKVFILDMSTVSPYVIEEIERNVIGYDD